MTTRHFTLLEAPAKVYGYDNETQLLLLETDDGDAVVGFIDEIYKDDQTRPEDLTEEQVEEWAMYTLGILPDDMKVYRNHSGSWEVATDVELW